MKIIGLTGSIGMGKSTAAAYLKTLDIPVHEADAVVHQLLSPTGAAFAAVAQAFPTVVEAGQINRALLGQLVFQNPAARLQLEAIIHPLVRHATQQWLAQQNAPLVVLDIPLLFETGRDKECNEVWVVSAPRFLQRRRVLARPHMTVEKLNQIEALQLSDATKRTRATRIIPTGYGLAVMRFYLRRAVLAALMA